VTTHNFGGLVPHLNNAPVGLVPHLNNLPTGLVSQLGPVHALPIRYPDPPLHPTPQMQALLAPPHTNATWDTPPTPTTAVDTSDLDTYGPQMKSWAMMAVEYGNEAGVDPDMVLAMALQEGAPLRTGLMGRPGAKDNLYTALQDPSTYRPNKNGPEAGILWDKGRLWASELGISKHGAGDSIGLTNQKKDPFDEVANMYSDQFSGDKWSDLVGNDDLAMKAAAYDLKMLDEGAASQATPAVRASQPLDQFLGSGYNAGGKLGRSLEVAKGVPGHGFQPNEVEHGESTVSVVKLADQILYGSGAYK